MVYLTRVEHFNAAHRLFNSKWSDEKNKEVFGGCSNKNWHGHNYELWVTVKAEPNPETGFAINAKILSKLINDLVLSQIDHKNINLEVGFMEGKNPTTENIAIGIWNELARQLPNDVQLYKIKLSETPRIFVEYFGE